MANLTDEELFFGGSQQQHEPKHEKADPYLVIRRSVNDVERRLRVLEERYANLRKKTQITDQNMLDYESHLSKELKMLTGTVNGLKFQVQEIAEKLALFNTEFEQVAKKRDLQVLEKYLDLWQPMNFVTRSELKDAVQKK